MQAEPKWWNNKNLLVELASNFRLLQQQNQQLRKLLQLQAQTPPTQPTPTPQKPKPVPSDKFSKDQQKILKLYSYKSWQQFMTWIEEKLEESGETISNGDEDDKDDKDDKEGSQIKRVLSEILEQPDFQESYTLDKQEEKMEKNVNRSQAEHENQVELLAIQNGKLRRENIQLKSKLAQIRALYLDKLQS